MNLPSPERALRETASLLKKHLDLANPPVIALQGPTPGGPDALLELEGLTFAVEWKSSASSRAVHSAIASLRRALAANPDSWTPLLVVPYMGDAGRQLCDAASIPWLDLSGNARVLLPTLRLVVEGRPNRFKKRGRPSSVFAPKSSRIVRWLLLHPHDSVTQRQLSQLTGVDEGQVNRLTRRLQKDGYVERNSDGTLQVPRPEILLDDLREAYSFERHDLVTGHIPSRNGPELLSTLSDWLMAQHVSHAATGLAAAWAYTQAAMFRLVTIYLEFPLDDFGRLGEVGFRPEAQGANTWLVVPNDRGVFFEGRTVSGVPCVHPLQVYLDLEEHPERSDEAAQAIRNQYLQNASLR